MKVEWLNAEMRISSFVFLFDKFKANYLSWLLPDFDRIQDIYSPALGKLLYDIVIFIVMWQI